MIRLVQNPDDAPIHDHDPASNLHPAPVVPPAQEKKILVSRPLRA